MRLRGDDREGSVIEARRRHGNRRYLRRRHRRISSRGGEIKEYTIAPTAKAVIGRPRVACSVVVPVIRARVYADRISRGFVGGREGGQRDNGPERARARVRAVSLPIV